MMGTGEGEGLCREGVAEHREGEGFCRVVGVAGRCEEVGLCKVL